MTRSALLALVLVAACSDKKEGTPTSTSTPPGELPASAVEPAPKSADSPGAPCELPWTPMVSRVLQASQHKVTIARREGSVIVCQFTSSEPNAVLQVRIEEGASPAAFEAAKQGAGGEPVADVPGLADKAYRFSLGNASHNIVAMKGRSMVSLSLAGGQMAPLLELAPKVVAAAP